MSQTPFQAPPGATITTCFRVVQDLASQGILDDSDPGMSHEVQRQTEAVDRLAALLDGNGEDLDFMTEDYDGLAYPLCDEDGFVREIDLDDIRAIADDPEMDVMTICFELACQQFRQEDLEGMVSDVDGIRISASDAVDLAAAFWELRHEEVKELDHADLDITEVFEDEGPQL
ncbi:MAG: hypothetical protein ABJN42_12960 [Roseibium sp.]|uniref:hypothetical protein n=1 Tax=Roseibium sp. TaxID=1936156 RepID=UPI003296BE4A